MRDDLFRLNDTKEHDPRVRAWFDDLGDSPRQMVKPWFARLRICGDDVREVLHDGCPTACVGDVAFAYVNAFMGHAAVGFFHGASLPDPKRLLEGTGKRMRHVKLRPGAEEDMMTMTALIDAAYDDIKRRIAQTSPVPPPLAGGICAIANPTSTDVSPCALSALITSFPGVLCTTTGADQRGVAARSLRP